MLEVVDVEARPQLDLGFEDRHALENRLIVDHVEAGLGQLQAADDDIRMEAAQDDANGQARILVGMRRHFDAIDQHFVGIAVARGERDDIDLHAVLPGDARLLLGLADVLVAVADEDDALGRAFRKGGQGELDGRRDIGIGVVDGAVDLAETQLARRRAAVPGAGGGRRR